MHTQTVTPLKSFGVGLSSCRLPKTFAENFRAMQERSGLTGRAISQASGIGESEISEYRTGSGGIPELGRLLRLALAMQCTLDELVEGLDENYDLARRDLIRLASAVDSGFPQDVVGGPTDVPASARVLPLLHDLIAAIVEQETQTGKMRDLANKLIDVAAVGSEGDSLADGRPASGTRNRKTD